MSQMKNRDSNRPRREQRQAEAQVRQDLYSKLSLAERRAKLDRTDKSGGLALRQRAKFVAAAKAAEQPSEKASQAKQEPARATKKGSKARSPSPAV